MDLDASQRERLGDILERSEAVHGNRREQLLDAVCHGDAALRAEAEALLALHDAAPRYLEEVAQEILPSAFAALASEVDDARVPKGMREGQRIGSYLVRGPLAPGGMGVVYRAHDPKLDRPVVLKLLPPHLEADDRAKKRLVHEARAISALDHPNICSIYEIGETDDGQLFLAMAFYDGETLKERIAAGAGAVEETISIARQIVHALEAAHRRNIVHRDIKPSNVMLTREGLVKMLDFGIAKVHDSDLTKEGTALGTVAYMSPEQTVGTDVGPESDIWSFGVVLYEMLTGRRPFAGLNDQAVIYAIRHDEPAPLRDIQPEIPTAIAKIAHRCLRKHPADRYPSASELLNDLSNLERNGSAPDSGNLRNRKRLALSASVALMAVLFVVLTMNGFRIPGQAPDGGIDAARSIGASSDDRGAANFVAGNDQYDRDAYELYLKGRYFVGKMERASLEKARSYFQQALDHDPTYAPAWSGLADAYDLLSGIGVMTPAEAYPRIRVAAENALAIDPQLAEAHASLGFSLSMYFWDTPLALHHLRRAIELNPQYARARRFYAAELRNHGRFEEALSEVRLAQQLDPFDEPAWIEEIIILYLSGRHDEAVATAELLLEREQGYSYVQIFVALANIQQAKFEEALAVLDAFDGARVQPDALCLRGYIYAVTDRGFEALRILDELDKQAGTDPAHLAFSRAVVYLAMGEQDMAFDALDQAATSRDWRMRLLRVEPLFEPLHSDSRFSDLLEKVGLREDVGSDELM